jgi:hypothetical protein
LPEAPFSASTVAASAAVNNNNNDVVSMLTDSLSRSGKGGMTAALAMGGNRVTGLGAATLRTDAAQLAQVQDQTPLWGGTAGGTADARAIAPTPPIAAYAAGQVFRFINGAAANAGAATLAVSGLTATAIRRGDGATVLTAGELPAGALIEVLYDGTVFRLLSVNASPTGTAMLYASDAAAGRAAIVAPPLPNAASGVGLWTVIDPGVGVSPVLAAGGTWAFLVFVHNGAGEIQGVAASLAPGGSTIAAVGGGDFARGFAWRVA